VITFLFALFKSETNSAIRQLFFQKEQMCQKVQISESHIFCSLKRTITHFQNRQLHNPACRAIRPFGFKFFLHICTFALFISAIALFVALFKRVIVQSDFFVALFKCAIVQSHFYVMLFKSASVRLQFLLLFSKG